MDFLRTIIQEQINILLESVNKKDFNLGYITTSEVGIKGPYHEVLYSKEPIGFFGGESPFGDFVFFSKKEIKTNLKEFHLIKNNGSLMNEFIFLNCKFKKSNYDEWRDNKEYKDYKIKYTIIPESIMEAGSGQYKCEPGCILVKKGDILTCSIDEEAQADYNRIMNSVIALIDTTYNDKLSYEKLVNLFLDVEKIIKFSLYTFQDLIKKDYSDKYKKFDEFFKKTHQLIREKAKKNKDWKKNINVIIKNSKNKLNDFKKVELAYEDTLDEYKDSWAGYWSLINVKRNGEIKGVFLGDSADVEYFSNNYKKRFGSLDENIKVIKQIIKTTLKQTLITQVKVQRVKNKGSEVFFRPFLC